MSCTKQVQYVSIEGCIDGEPVYKLLAYSTITPGTLIGTFYSDGSDGTGWTAGACPLA